MECALTSLKIRNSGTQRCLFLVALGYPEQKGGNEMEQISLTEHARIRMTARRIPAVAVEMALLYGREKHMNGATFYAIGRREVERFGDTGVDLSVYEGIQVVCAQDDVVVTAYRNRDFSGLRPRRPKRHRRRLRGRQVNPGNHEVAA